MYHSYSYQDEAFDFFVTFLNNTLEGNESYKSLVNPIINEAHLLAKGEKDYYSINRNNYSIITYLAENDKDFFSSLNINRLSEENYRHILEIANSQRHALFA